MEKKLQKKYPTYSNYLIVQELWQVHDNIISITFLKELIRLNVHRDTMIENRETEFNINIANVFLNTQMLKIF